MQEYQCVSLVGMAGAGKTTVGGLLAGALGWAQVDTDRLVEAYCGAPLQAIMDRLGRDEFVRVEEQVVSRLDLRRTVVSTGGSVVYGSEAVARLKELGPVVYLHASVAAICDRVGDGGGRGLAIGPGQSLQDLYDERRPLYEQAADIVIDTSGLDPRHGVRELVAKLGVCPANPI